MELKAAEKCNLRLSSGQGLFYVGRNKPIGGLP